MDRSKPGSLEKELGYVMQRQMQFMEHHSNIIQHQKGIHRIGKKNPEPHVKNINAMLFQSF